MDRYGILRREPSLSVALAGQQKVWRHRDWLYRMYWQQGLSLHGMAEKAGCDAGCIKNWMDEYEIPMRTRSEAVKLAWRLGRLGGEEQCARWRETTKAAWERGTLGSEEWRCKVVEGTTRAWEEGRLGDANWHLQHDIGIREAVAQRRQEKIYWNEGWLREKYWDEKLSVQEIAEEAGCQGTVVLKAMRELRIPRRSRSDALREAWKKGTLTAFSVATSSLELKMAAGLGIMGIEYVPQYRLAGDSHNYDFYVPVTNLLIEVDGEFWHHSEWAREHGAVERDRKKDALAAERGYSLLRIRERDIQENGAWAIVIERIVPLVFSVG